MSLLEINNLDRGQLFTHKSTLSNGLFLNVKHNICNKLSIATKQVNFTHVSFNRTSDRFLACDLQGSIYLFDLSYNRFEKLHRLGTKCTDLAFNLKCRTEYLVAFVDGTIKCFNTETRGDLVGWMKGHEKPIISLSVHPSRGDLVISFSADLAQLWDLKTFECKQKLNIDINKNLEIVKICFAPNTGDVVSLFKDDFIYVWEVDDKVSLKCKLNPKDVGKDAAYKHSYRCFSISSDGKWLAIGSRYGCVHLWNLHENSFLRSLVLEKNETNQTDQQDNIRDVVFLPGANYGNRILLILTQSGSINVYNIESDEMICNMTSTKIKQGEKPTHVDISPNARYMSTLTEDGCIQLFNLDDSSTIRRLKTTASLMTKTLATTTNNTTTFSKKKSKRAQEEFSVLMMKTDKKSAAKSGGKGFLDSGHQIYSKLLNILNYYKEYPSRYRMFIWKILLRLPENYQVYSSFVERGLHPQFKDLAGKYPIKSQKCIRLMEKVLSALAYWSPIFTECEYLPLLVFPFIKLYQNNQVVCFEIVATFINNWCQQWFEFYPNPPMNTLNMIENLIAYHDKTLLDHLIRYRITSQIYGWILLQSVFSEVLSRQEWLILFDNVLSNHPGYLLYVIASYSICNRTALLQIKELDDARYFFHHRNSINLQHLISQSYEMMRITPADIDPCKLLKPFQELPKQTYPVFNKQPKFINDYQILEKNKILEQEAKYLREREAQIEGHKVKENQKLEKEYLLKQMLFDKVKREKNATQHEEWKLPTNCQNIQNIKLNDIKACLGGEAMLHVDSMDNINENRAHVVDEDLDHIQEKLREKFKLSTRAPSEMSACDFTLDEQKDKNNGTMLSNLSLDRNREQFEAQTRQTMKRIYDLRKEFAIESRKSVNSSR